MNTPYGMMSGDRPPAPAARQARCSAMYSHSMPAVALPPYSGCRPADRPRFDRGRCVLLHVLDALEQRGVLGAVLGAHRCIAPANSFLSATSLISTPAAFILASDCCSISYQSLRCSCCASLRGFCDQRLVVEAEADPAPLGEHQELRDHQVAGARVVPWHSGNAGRSRSVGSLFSAPSTTPDCSALTSWL